MLTVNGDMIIIKTDDFEIEFNISEMGKSVKYDKDTHQLIISDLPEDMIKKIKQALMC